MTITTSRRTVLLAAAAALPALALPVLAMPAIAAPAFEDPIFKAIEQHRAANKTFHEVLSRKGALEEKHPDLWQKSFPGVPLGEGLNFEIVPGVEIPIRIRTQKEVTGLMRMLTTQSEPKRPRAELKELEASWRAQVQKESANYKAGRRAAGFDAIDRAEIEYGGRENDARDLMLRCQPTTAVGLAAFLAYAIECQIGRHDGDEMEIALRTAAAAAKSLG